MSPQSSEQSPFVMGLWLALIFPIN